MKIPLSRHTPVIAIVAGCLLLGTTGGAIAGSKITSGDIKNNTVASKDIKDGTVASKDVKNKTLLKKDIADKTVKALTGARGASAWDTIPSGVTVTGRFFDTGREYATATQVVENINFPGVAPAAPTGYGFGNDAFALTVSDPACAGSALTPTAPAGRVCVYLDGLENLTGPGVRRWDNLTHAPYTFFIEFASTPNTQWRYWGTWAYTAP